MTIKWMGDDGSPRKAIYHRYLVKASPLVMKFKGEPRESKYKGKPPYVYFQVQGDESEYALNIEPGTEEAIQDAPKNTWVTVYAAGSKDTEAALKIVAGAQDPEDGPPNEWPDEDPASEPKQRTPPTAKASGPDKLMQECWTSAVVLIRADFPDASPDAAVEAASRVANTLFIGRNR